MKVSFRITQAMEHGKGNESKLVFLTTSLGVKQSLSIIHSSTLVILGILVGKFHLAPSFQMTPEHHFHH